MVGLSWAPMRFILTLTGIVVRFLWIKMANGELFPMKIYGLNLTNKQVLKRLTT